MSSNHYSNEDSVPDTPETMLANWNAQAGALTGIAPQAAIALNRNEELLNYVEALVSEDDKPYVQESKAITQQMAEQLTRFDLAHIQAGKFLRKMVRMHSQLAGDYEELQNDLVGINRDNPLVDRAVDSIEEGIYDEMHHEDLTNYAEALEEAYEQVFTEIHEGVRQNTGCDDWGAIFRFSDLLTGNAEPTDEQRRLLSMLLQSCQRQEAADATP